MGPLRNISDTKTEFHNRAAEVYCEKYNERTENDLYVYNNVHMYYRSYKVYTTIISLSSGGGVLARSSASLSHYYTLPEQKRDDARRTAEKGWVRYIIHKPNVCVAVGLGDDGEGAGKTGFCVRKTEAKPLSSCAMRV